MELYGGTTTLRCLTLDHVKLLIAAQVADIWDDAAWSGGLLETQGRWTHG